MKNKVMMGTITDTPRSADLSGHSTDNPSPASGSLPNKPRNKFQYTAGVTSTSDPLAAPHDSETLPTAGPGKDCTRQASRSKSEAEIPAARCRVILGQELKQLSKAQSHPKNIQVGYNVNFQYSARNPAACVPVSATKRTIITARSKQIYRRKTAIHATDKKGSYAHYLVWKIKQVIAKIASCDDDLGRDINLLNSKMDLYAHELTKEINLMKFNAIPYTHDFRRKITLLNSKLDAYIHDIDMVGRQLNSKMRSYSGDLIIKLNLLNSKIGPYADEVDRQTQLLNSKLAVSKEEFKKKLKLLNSKVPLFVQLKMESQELVTKSLLKCKNM